VNLPVHTSLEREFQALVPPRQPPLKRRLLWWLLLQLIALRPVQSLILKRARA